MGYTPLSDTPIVYLIQQEQCRQDKGHQRLKQMVSPSPPEAEPWTECLSTSKMLGEKPMSFQFWFFDEAKHQELLAELLVHGDQW